MRILITGAEGFVAHHLAPYLIAKNVEVIGTALDPAKARELGIPVRPLNITKVQETASLIRHVLPTHIVHLAAVSSVGKSFADPQAVIDVNVEGTKNVLSAAAGLEKPPVTLIVGSSDEYGVNGGQPLTELPVAELRPVSPYAKSKKVIEELIESTPAYKAMVIRTRSFPHLGPGQVGPFFVPEMASQIIKIERGQQHPVIRVGNLSAVRDYTDVRDVVRAYYLLLEKGELGEVYNVCSGGRISMKEMLEKMLPLSKIPARYEHGPEKDRPADIPVLIGDNTKLKKQTGWQPEISLDRTLKDVVEFFRGKPS